MSSLRHTRAFTLVELLVSMAVLSLLIVLVAQLMSTATATIATSRKHMDADSQARLIFDRMAVDFSRMLARKDIDYHMRKINGSSDEIAFYGEGAGYYSEAGANVPSRNARSPVSILGYRVFSGSINGKLGSQLQRVSKGLGWEPNGTVWQDTAYLPITLVAGPNARWPNLFSTSATDPDFQAMSDQVFRFEYTYLLSDGTFSSKPVRNVPGVKCSLAQTTPPSVSNDQTDGYSVGSRWFDTNEGKGYVCVNASSGVAVWGSTGIQDLGAIVVAIAILDPTSRVIVNDFTTLAGSLPDAPATGDIASVWNSTVKSGTFAQSAGISQQAASAVRIYQRFFSFPASQ